MIGVENSQYLSMKFSTEKLQIHVQYLHLRTTVNYTAIGDQYFQLQGYSNIISFKDNKLSLIYGGVGRLDLASSQAYLGVITKLKLLSSLNLEFLVYKDYFNEKSEAFYGGIGVEYKSKDIIVSANYENNLLFVRRDPSFSLNVTFETSPFLIQISPTIYTDSQLPIIRLSVFKIL